MRILSRRSLRVHLLLLVLLAAFPALGLIVYDGWAQRERAAQAARTSAGRLATLAAAQQADVVSHAHRLVLTLAQVPAVRQHDARACRALFTQLLPHFPSLTNLSAATPDGQVFCSAVPLPGPVTFADRDYFRRTLATRAFTVGEYTTGRITGRPLLTFAFPVTEGSAAVHAVLVGGLDLAWLNQIAATAGLPAGSTFTVIDRAGVILARNPDPERWVGKAVPEAPLIQTILAQREGTTEAVGTDGVPRLYGFTVVPSTTPAGAVYVAVGIPRAAAFAEVDRLFIRHVMALGGVVALALLTAWLVADRLIVRRVQALVRATQRVAAGDLQARTGLPHDDGELSELARAFDQMTAILAQREAERTQAAVALQASEDQVRQLQKLEAIGQLAGGVAHDFNNLLTVIMGRTEILLRGAPADDRLGRNLALILKTGERAAALTRQLLAFGRKQILEPQVLDLNGVVTDLAKMLRRLIGETIELMFHPGSDLGRVKADPAQLEQVLVNLVVNARDAMPEGGRVTIETANVELSELYTRQHVGAHPGPYVLLAVSDTGIGMDAATQARIFEPFFTTKEPGKGTGLGLSTVYGIIKQSGGNIWVYSEPGQGATFKIYLPRVDETATRVAPVLPAPLRGTETILVAEDDAEVRALACEALESYGYTVFEAGDPAEASLIAERHTGPIHLLITDVVMPRMSGRRLAELLAPLRPEMTVLYMSGYTDNAIVHHGTLDPGTPFIQKPFPPDGLARKVREVLDARE